MNATVEVMQTYKDFEVKADILFFKVGTHGIVSFHGSNYNIKKQLPAEQLNKLISDSGFFQIDSKCYVNVNKISSIDSDHISFRDQDDNFKYVPISKRKQQMLKNVWSGTV